MGPRHQLVTREETPTRFQTHKALAHQLEPTDPLDQQTDPLDQLTPEQHPDLQDLHQQSISPMQMRSDPRGHTSSRILHTRDLSKECVISKVKFELSTRGGLTDASSSVLVLMPRKTG